MLTKADVHVDQILTNLSIRYKNQSYIAENVFPVMRVVKESDKYFIFGKNHFRLPNTERALNGEANFVNSVGLSTGAYSCVEHALKDFISNRTQAAADGLDPEADTAEALTDLIMLRLEKLVAAAAFSTTNFTNNVTLSGTNQWSDLANSDPLTNVTTGIHTVISKTGRKPNVIVMGDQVFQKLKTHPDILDRLKYTTTAVPTEAILANLFDVEQLYVGTAIENTAVEGQTDVMAYVWGKDVGIYIVNPAQSQKIITAGRIFRQQDYRKVEKWYDNDKGGNVIQVADLIDAKVVAADAGYLIKAAVA